jgi:hypothetical protein
MYGYTHYTLPHRSEPTVRSKATPCERRMVQIIQAISGGEVNLSSQRELHNPEGIK